MDLQSAVDNLAPAACIVSVEKFENGDYGKIRIVTGNKPYIATIENPAPGVELQTNKFIPDSEYTAYMPRDLNFEDSCYQAAVNKKSIHSYAHPERFNVWFNMSFIPIGPEDGNICYCIYMVEVDFKPDAKRMSTISSDIATAVLETCIRLRSHNDFKDTMKVVCSDIRGLCGSESCVILLMDTVKRKCSLLCESYTDDVPDGFSMEPMINDSFYDMAYSWIDSIAGSNCLMVRNQHDMNVIKERNPAWYESLVNTNGKTLVLFPLEFKGELLGFIWAANFDASLSDTIKETLELTSFILASELYSFRLLDELNVLSSNDMLTGVYNRNVMNNFVESLLKNQDKNPSDDMIAVVFADVNGLKRVNDNEGHAAGDLLLKKAALTLQRFFGESRIYRAGGDEYVIFAENISEQQLEEKLNALRAATSEPSDEVCFAVGSDIGRAADIRRTMQNADAEMYADKLRFYETHPELKRS
ncbi:MAG: GGDEF domain-containing protein [Oscillospiraceae bacterium]|nr:GGDEF domain-containing protein [Oscillospiraceae bacterium]